MSNLEEREKVALEYAKFNRVFYTYYTLHSFELGTQPKELTPFSNEILICNASRCAHYTSISLSTHGIFMFETGTGLGIPGMHVTIIRKDLIGKHLPICPDMMEYQKTLKANSVINTPFTLVVLSIYKMLEVLEREGRDRKRVREELEVVK